MLQSALRGRPDSGFMESGTKCSVFSRCGGCNLLDIPYRQQLAQKQQYIQQLFAELDGSACVRPIKGMENPVAYRNKVITPFVAGQKLKNGKRKILTGMYEAGTHRVIDSTDCILENPVAHDVIRGIKQIMQKHGIQPYDEDRGTGFMRHAVIRIGHESQEVLVTLVTNSREFPYAKSFCRELVKKVPAITSVVQNVNLRQTNVILGQEEHVLYGPGFILDTLCGLSFRISSQSFYQVNSVQTEVLYASAIELACLNGGSIVMDAYCGTGTIGLVAAANGASRVIGIDSVQSSIRDAVQNARHNGIDNAEFICADAAQVLMREGMPEGCTLMMDPPRAGSSPEFLDATISSKPKRIVYISCNPETQVRDVKRLIEGGYSIESIQPVDMFSHTKHVENIVSMAI